MPGTEVVHGDPDAMGAQARQRLGDAFRLAHYVEWIGNLNPHASRPWPMIAAVLAALLVIGFFGQLLWRRSRPPATTPGVRNAGDPALMADLHDAIAGDKQIGRAAGRERSGQLGSISVVAD